MRKISLSFCPNFACPFLSSLKESSLRNHGTGPSLIVQTSELQSAFCLSPWLFKSINESPSQQNPLRTRETDPRLQVLPNSNVIGADVCDRARAYLLRCDILASLAQWALLGRTLKRSRAGRTGKAPKSNVHRDDSTTDTDHRCASGEFSESL